MLQTSCSSCAINFRVNRHRFLYLGIILNLSTATLTVFCILSETTLPIRAPRGLFRRGGLVTRFQPGIVDMSASSLLDMSAKSADLVTGPPSSLVVIAFSVVEKERAVISNCVGSCCK